MLEKVFLQKTPYIVDGRSESTRRGCTIVAKYKGIQVYASSVMS